MHLRVIEPIARGWQHFAWDGGAFDTAQRAYTPVVEGTIRIPDHLVLVTLRGGARQVEIATDSGHRYVGPDRPGAVSFVPANCERRLTMRDVAAEWASVAIRPDLLTEDEDDRPGCAPGPEIAPFSNVQDLFLASMVADFKRLHGGDGLDRGYCDVMSRALACYLLRRYGRPDTSRADIRIPQLPQWRIRRINEYVEAHLSDDLRIVDLARLVGLSAGHLHRAFRETVGVTPLEYINEKRVRRAMAILAAERISIAELALRVGFVSPSHLTRMFRRVTGQNPSQFRAEMAPGPLPGGRS